MISPVSYDLSPYKLHSCLSLPRTGRWNTSSWLHSLLRMCLQENPKLRATSKDVLEFLRSLDLSRYSSSSSGGNGSGLKENNDDDDDDDDEESQEEKKVWSPPLSPPGLSLLPYLHPANRQSHPSPPSYRISTSSNVSLWDNPHLLSLGTPAVSMKKGNGLPMK